MKPLLRFRLQTLLIIFFCFAVGLAAYRDLMAAWGPAAITVMVVGLLQQIRALCKVQPSVGKSTSDGSFALIFSIGWRGIIAGFMTFFVVTSAFGWVPAFFRPERDDLMMQEPAYAIYMLCPIAVLLSTVERWRCGLTKSPSNRSQLLLLGVAVVLVAGFLVVDGNLIIYLVHKAMYEMEAAIPTQFQRPNVYPNHADEGHRSFWISFAAVSFVVLGFAALILAAGRLRSRKLRCLYVGIFVACLLIQVAFCYWYYEIEFRRISPDFAGVGLSAVWVDWCTTFIIVAGLASAGAYRLAQTANDRGVVVPDMAEDMEAISVYETFPGLCLLAPAAIASLLYLAIALAEPMPLLPTFSLWFTVAGFCNPTSLLTLAQAFLTFQLAWLRWRRRSEIVPWLLPAASPVAFAWNWIAIVLAIVAGIPTINSLAFTFWLGPFNLTAW